MKILGKAESLIFLEKKQLKYSYTVPPLIKYTKEHYYKNKERVLSKVLKKFNKQKLIIR